MPTAVTVRFSFDGKTFLPQATDDEIGDLVLILDHENPDSHRQAPALRCPGLVCSLSRANQKLARRLLLLGGLELAVDQHFDLNGLAIDFDDDLVVF